MPSRGFFITVGIGIALCAVFLTLAAVLDEEVLALVGMVALLGAFAARELLD